jgi:fructokinase
MGAKILSMGEALVDVLPADDSLWKPVPGGSSYNVALALGRLGASCGFVGRLSRDEQGERMIDILRRAGVDTSLCARDERPSPLSLVSRGTQDTSAHYAIYLDGTAHAPPDLPAGWLDGAAHLHVSSFSAISGPWGEAVASALAAARGRVSTSLDVNIRPLLIPARKKALELIEARIEQVDLVKASDEDLGWLFPERDPGETASDWAKSHACLVLLTRGAQGASAFFAGERLDSEALPVAVVDTIGAGDCFVAAFLAGTVAAASLPVRSLDRALISERLAFANAAAALCCARIGADPGTRGEIEPLRGSY